MAVETGRALELPQRPRRLRRSATLRRLVRETTLSAADLILPLFVDDEASGRRPISSMPGQYRWSVDRLPEVIEATASRGIPGVLLFGVPAEKHDDGRGAWDPAGCVQRAIARIKAAAPELLVMTDVCLCEYTTHGHCGLIDDHSACNPLNDASVELLVRMALSHAEAGADVVAPSDMFDGRVGAIRHALDDASFEDVAIVSYAAKYAMVKAAAANGWIDERRIVLENLLAMRRAGADFIFTYHAHEVVDYLNE